MACICEQRYIYPYLLFYYEKVTQIRVNDSCASTAKMPSKHSDNACHFDKFETNAM
jgi:hypothetical protein